MGFLAVQSVLCLFRDDFLALESRELTLRIFASIYVPSLGGGALGAAYNELMHG